MGQSIYFDFDFNNSVDKIVNMNGIPKYYKNTMKVSKEELFEPLRFLLHYIPENIRDVFDEKQIIAVLKPLHKNKECYDNDKREIVFKGFKFKEEHKRSLAYFLGSVFSKFVPNSTTIEVESPTIDENENDRTVQFLLDGEYFDKEMFFGFLFEYLYLVEKQKDIEINKVGVIETTPEVYKNAFDIFITKYLNEFSKLACSYREKRVKYKLKMAELSKKHDDFIYQDASCTLQDDCDSTIDSSLRLRIATFNKVLKLIHLRLTSKQYKEIFKKCLEKQKDDDKQEDVERAVYGYLIQEFERNIEKQKDNSPSKSLRNNFLFAKR